MRRLECPQIFLIEIVHNLKGVEGLIGLYANTALPVLEDHHLSLPQHLLPWHHANSHPLPPLSLQEIGIGSDFSFILAIFSTYMRTL